MYMRWEKYDKDLHRVKEQLSTLAEYIIRDTNARTVSKNKSGNLFKIQQLSHVVVVQNQIIIINLIDNIYQNFSIMWL